ncbi:MAG: L,D-transpeptidase [Anaerolineae bacterium]|nr:L,D-transpeptidase [Anaerolineae bacterium]
MSGHNQGLRRFRETRDPRPQALAYLEAGKRLMREGDIVQARRLLRAAVETDSYCSEAWLQLAWLAPNPRSRRVLLRRVLAVEPEHRAARAEMARLQVMYPNEGRVPVRRQRNAAGPWLLALLAIVALLALGAAFVWGPVDITLARWLPTPTVQVSPTPTLTPAQVAARFGPQLEAARKRGDWQRALEIVRIIQGVDPAGEQVRRWAFDTYMECGQHLVDQGEVAEALEQFDAAVATASAAAPGDTQAAVWQEVSRLYLAADDAQAAGDGAVALGYLSQAHDRLPEFGDVRARLVDAYLQQGEAAIAAATWATAIQTLSEGHEYLPDEERVTDLLAMAYAGRAAAWQAQGDLDAERTDLESVLALRPDDEQARARYERVMYILFPPKRIEINLTTQHFYAYEGDTLIYSFPTSTGLRGRDTAPGHFEVLDKIPMAYSSVWNLQMPYWLGIYYVGNIENGIHALPIRPDGSVMWGGLLGQRASYGCVILSTEAARLVYEWAEIGTEVHIHY